MKILVLLFVSALLTGCASWYSFNGIRYNSHSEAYEAQGIFYNNIVENIKPSKNAPYTDKTILIADYSFVEAKDMIKIINNYNVVEDAANYLAATSQNDWGGVAESLRKSGIFANTRRERIEYDIEKKFPAKRGEWTLAYQYVAGVGDRFALYNPNQEVEYMTYNRGLTSGFVMVQDLVDRIGLHVLAFQRLSESDSSTTPTANPPATTTSNKPATSTNPLPAKSPKQDLAQSQSIEQKPISFKGVGKWKKNINTDPITDEQVIVGSLKSEGSSQTYRNNTGLYIRCDAGKVDIYVDFDDYLGNEYFSVTSRVDKKEPFTLLWGLSTDKEAAFFPRDTKTLMRELFAAERFVVRATPYNENPKTLIFDVKGVYNLFEAHRKTCLW